MRVALQGAAAVPGGEVPELQGHGAETPHAPVTHRGAQRGKEAEEEAMESIPLFLSRETRSTWMTHFLRYTWTTLPSLSLRSVAPRLMTTSSPFRMGTERT